MMLNKQEAIERVVEMMKQLATMNSTDKMCEYCFCVIPTEIKPQRCYCRCDD